jgi:hypothetical protein
MVQAVIVEVICQIIVSVRWDLGLLWVSGVSTAVIHLISQYDRKRNFEKANNEYRILRRIQYSAVRCSNYV